MTKMFLPVDASLALLDLHEEYQMSKWPNNFIQ